MAKGKVIVGNYADWGNALTKEFHLEGWVEWCAVIASIAKFSKVIVVPETDNGTESETEASPDKLQSSFSKLG